MFLCYNFKVIKEQYTLKIKYPTSGTSQSILLQLLAFFLMLLILSLPGTALADSGDNSSAMGKRWSSFLPIWGEEARQQGHELSLPFGVTANFMFIKQDYEVERIDLDINGIQLNLPPSIVGGEVNGDDRSMVMRFDAWILPFLNIYAILGYTDGETTTDVSFLPGTKVLSFPFKLEYKGPTYGGGVTLAGGTRNIFVVFDLNYTETDLDISDSRITAMVFSPRIGWHGTIGSWKGSFWVGGMYQDIEQVIKGRVRLSQISAPVEFEVKQKAADPWNMTLGMQWNITSHIDLIVEGGFVGREQILTSIGYRF